jgi:two-component system, chemotaxis family, chemotaxis protein CheY
MNAVMIVDDNAFARQRMAELLTKEGYKVHEAGDGEQAVTLYRSLRPKVAILDITMPKKDGLEALKDIIAFDARACVVMLTALDQPAIISKALRLGAKDYLKKPVASIRLLATLQKLLA